MSRLSRAMFLVSWSCLSLMGAAALGVQHNTDGSEGAKHAVTRDKKAEVAPGAADKPPEKKADGKDDPKRFVTKHELALGDGSTIHYTATAGETFLRDDKGKVKASMFTIAYTKDGVTDPSTRPVAFVFNGGPGSSAVWLHLGLLGPKRVDVPSDGTGAGAPPYRLQDNPLSLLSVTDLIFVDPIGTGFSHAVGDGKEDKDENYWGVDEDSRSVAQFIRNYITEKKRWNSPKYLIGESYGTIRAAVLVRDLQSLFSPSGFSAVTLNGIVLVSPAMDVRFLLGYGTDVPYITYLPTYAATAWHHNALPNKPPDMKAFLVEVKEFAVHEYLVALFRGDTIDDAAKKRILDKLHEYTGLSKTYLANAKLRVNASRFMKELLRDRGLVVGSHDSRYTGVDPDDNAGEYPSDNPSGYGVVGAFVATMNDYLTRDLEVKMDRDYTIMNVTANRKWKQAAGYNSIFGGFLNVLPYLAQGMTANKDLRVFVASGYFDLTTAFFASEYMISHSGMDKNRVTMKHYGAGHMMYVHQPSFEQLAKDLRAFIEER